jgi:hypothetical protein
LRSLGFIHVLRTEAGKNSSKCAALHPQEFILESIQKNNVSKGGMMFQQIQFIQKSVNYTDIHTHTQTHGFGKERSNDIVPLIFVATLIDI